MARGKIQIKKIENQTNRQVTYSKRRNGLFKKANELTVLCDAKVSIVMISSTGKLHEFISPSITTKQLFDLYQKTIGVDIWTTHYEKMQEQLRKLKDVNRNLRKEIRQRMGESLNDLNYEQLEELMENVDNSLKLIRERKYKVIGNQIETYRKKVRNVEEIHRNLLLEFDARQEDPYGGLVEQEGDYNSVLGFPTGGHHILALGLQPNNNHHLHSGGGSDITTFALG
ncbi:floral homeotic protein PMADS 1 [Solanum stenotomum]|uniref:floral homeotic protein PMADS 1 n=1 Tax=Solanum stenotomum TaxID=172797 RepID=UPI0020D17F57|nr:floral homeotic protein PMADS 1 [Solanum stenotomum]XP_049390681.1 floral homeotic protein PMADS 1 [Solanum stenotomum]XP_049390682.1 floral homeotic protein PMADS 1 [Solanum stenotomum]